MPDVDEDRGTARQDLCRFLAACYYEPGPEFAEEKLFDSMLQAAGRVDPALAADARRLGEQYSAAEPQGLLLDYARLFLGPTNVLAKPYGSAWLEADGGLMQDSTTAVVALYEEGGFDIADDFRELPDHIAVELEFLYLLLFRENEARRNADAQALEAASALRRRFLAEHLGRWVGRFAAAVASGAQSSFYRELAELTERFVTMEAAAAAATT